jgi:hypothetical protein
MEALIEIIAMSAGFLVLCSLIFLVYFLIRKFKTLSKIYLGISIIIIVHLLIIFTMIYIPGFLPNFLLNYGAFWFKLFT